MASPYPATWQAANQEGSGQFAAISLPALPGLSYAITQVFGQILNFAPGHSAFAPQIIIQYYGGTAVALSALQMLMPGLETHESADCEWEGTLISPPGLSVVIGYNSVQTDCEEQVDAQGYLI
jgi:hypothetical protein